MEGGAMRGRTASNASRRARRVLLVSALGVVFCGFAGAGGASAKLITVGSPLTASFTSHEFGQAETVMNSRLGETGAQVTSPISGSIIRWHITLATGGPFFLRALTPEICCSGYVGSGSLSAGEVPVSTATQTYKTDLPIEKGDFIGLDNSNGSDTIGLASVSVRCCPALHHRCQTPTAVGPPRIIPMRRSASTQLSSRRPR